jgi:uncharacterized protein (DUF2235 family)
MKNLLIFSDGTSNTSKTNTNVHQFYKALKPDINNVCFYDRGVGSFKTDLAGMVFGAGVANNIRECYEFLVDNYVAGDRIFVFGFSRGAYTARSLASFVSMVGIVQETNKKQRRRKKKKQRSPQQIAIQKAYDVYRRNKKSTFKKALKKLGDRYDILAAQIYGIGVWDTVGALGLPDLKKNEVAYDEHKYHNMMVPKACKLAYHALAIDEERRTFEPIQFKKRAKSTTKVDEVWFPGMHSDVGGGYKTKVLSNLSLHWMASKFSSALNFNTTGFGIPKPRGEMHDSDKKIYSSRTRVLPKNSRLHASVATRITGPLTKPNKNREAQGVYRPRALKNAKFDTPPRYGLNKNYKLLAPVQQG